MSARIRRFSWRTVHNNTPGAGLFGLEGAPRGPTWACTTTPRLTQAPHKPPLSDN